MAYKFRIYGWRDGLHAKPMTMVHTVEQAAQVAVEMKGQLQAFDSAMTGLGPVNVRVEPIESEGWKAA